MIFHGDSNVDFLLFIRDVVVVISPKVVVVLSVDEVIYIAEVPVVPSRSEVPCAKHNLHGISLTFQNLTIRCVICLIDMQIFLFIQR